MQHLRPLRLLLTSSIPVDRRPAFAEVQARLDSLSGHSIQVSAKTRLTAYRGELFSGLPGKGTAVHAASFIRSRRIVLEKELLIKRNLFPLILVHELFHFVWVRLGNPARGAFRTLLVRERQEGARGELGESASARKALLKKFDLVCNQGLSWPEYACESFCDTAAWFYLRDVPDAHRTLAARWRDRREGWCEEHFTGHLAC